MTLEQVFHTLYEPMLDDRGCWEWTGTVHPAGYGQVTYEYQHHLAHRLSWEVHVGPIPPGEGPHGTCVLHRCDNRLCVNPKHLFLGSNADNMADKCAKGKMPKMSKGDDEPCPRGHVGNFRRYSGRTRKLRDGSPMMVRRCMSCYGIKG
jgi:HNH endonuclease